MSEEQRKVFEKYGDPETTEKILKASTRSLCRPSESFSLQPQQSFLEKYALKSRGLLIFHKIGSGKTCTAIRIAEAWKRSKRNIIVVVPAFLKSNFYQELLGPCGSYKSATDINKVYTILSCHKFIEKLPRLSLRNTLLIIDEVQNMISKNGVFYRQLKQKIDGAPDDLHVVLLSATPIFDHPIEIALTLNLLPNLKEAFTDDFVRQFIEATEEGDLRMHQQDLFRSKIRGMVSFYPGMPQRTFPKKKIRVVPCAMSAFQYRSYVAAARELRSVHGYGSDILNLPTSFFLGTRITSNVAFPNRKGNAAGFKSWTQDVLSDKEKLKSYSIKFFKILNRLNRTPRGVKILLYSSFAKYGGILSLSKVLEAHGYVRYGAGEKRSNKRMYAIWSGSQSLSARDAIRDAFNDPESGMDIILGSPSIREGVTLKRVEQIHILEPYWNTSRLEQVIGRGVRFCSHITLPSSRRRVEIYVYIAVRPDEKAFKSRPRILERYSVDRYIFRLALKKKQLVSDFEKVLREASVDYLLYK